MCSLLIHCRYWRGHWCSSRMLSGPWWRWVHRREWLHCYRSRLYARIVKCIEYGLRRGMLLFRGSLHTWRSWRYRPQLKRILNVIFVELFLVYTSGGKYDKSSNCKRIIFAVCEEDWNSHQVWILWITSWNTGTNVLCTNFLQFFRIHLSMVRAFLGNNLKGEILVNNPP